MGPSTLRALICTVCGLPNTDQSWKFDEIGGWTHTCPQPEPSEDEPTPTTVEYPLITWTHPVDWVPDPAAPPRKK